MSDYRYTEHDLLEVREHYHYSRLQGPDFISTYRAARLAALESLPDAPPLPRGPAAPLPDGTAPIQTDTLLDALEYDPFPAWIDRLVQRFEVTKRLYPSYDARLRKGTGATDDLRPYMRLARLLATDTAQLDWLNALLKLHDLLLSQESVALTPLAGTLRTTLQAELDAVARLESRHD